MFATLRKHSGPLVCSWVPRGFWHRLLGLELLLPRYHMISDNDVPHVSGLYKFRTVRQFKADLDFFLRSYTPVTLQDIISYLDGKHELPKRCFLLTFDDGFREMYDIVAPILRNQGVPAVFFLVTSTIDNHELCISAKTSLLLRSLSLVTDTSVKRQISNLLSDAQITGNDLPSRFRNITYRRWDILRDLASILHCDFADYLVSTQPYLTSAQAKELIGQGFSIGAHSVNHPLYSQLNLEEQLGQTTDSIDWLSERLQYECQSFAFPYRATGVSPEFFERAFADGRLKVSFGTNGMRTHFFRRNLERFTMEKTDRKAAVILAREFGVTLFAPAENQAAVQPVR